MIWEIHLKQRIPTYSNYVFDISLGAIEFGALGRKLNWLPPGSLTDSEIGSLLQFIKPRRQISPVSSH